MDYSCPACQTRRSEFGMVYLVEKQSHSLYGIFRHCGRMVEMITYNVVIAYERASCILQSVVDYADCRTEGIRHRLIATSENRYLFSTEVEHFKTCDEVIPIILKTTVVPCA